MGSTKSRYSIPTPARSNPQTGQTVMKEVLSIAGPTPDPDNISPSTPDAVREWCINTAAVDPFTDSILVNNEDGHLYRWDLATNTLSQSIDLSGGLGEAYTSTVIGPDGTVYAINESTLFAVVPEPTTALMLTITLTLFPKRPSDAGPERKSRRPG